MPKIYERGVIYGEKLGKKYTNFDNLEFSGHGEYNFYKEKHKIKFPYQKQVKK